MLKPPLEALAREILRCEACPRLRSHCRKIAKQKRRAFRDERYWGKPIAGFGDSDAGLVILGLAPAAHGANRTGRIFTGDQSGLWLYRALHRAGFANQSTWERRDDGLRLRDAWVTCVARCAPPANKPTREELARCGPYLARELRALGARRVTLVLGQIALQAAWPHLLDLARSTPEARPRFRHGAEHRLQDGTWLLMSYHPSQQNTFTRRLTEPMFDAVLTRARELLRAR